MLFYLLSIGGLLWLFFNPNGILVYNTKSKEVRLLIKQLKQYEDHFKCLGETREIKKALYYPMHKELLVF